MTYLSGLGGATVALNAGATVHSANDAFVVIERDVVSETGHRAEGAARPHNLCTDVQCSCFGGGVPRRTLVLLAHISELSYKKQCFCNLGSSTKLVP